MLSKISKPKILTNPGKEPAVATKNPLMPTASIVAATSRNVMTIPNEKPEDIAGDRIEALKDAQEAFPDLEDRFKPGSFGHFEAMDRAMVICESWFHYVQDHPSVVLNEELYARAHQIGADLHDFYQKIALVDCDAEDAFQKLEFARFVAWAKQAGFSTAEDMVQKFLNREPMQPFVVLVEKDEEDVALSIPYMTYAKAHKCHQEQGNDDAWIQDAVGQKWYPKHPDFHKLAET
jgi:hypothetical protein